MTYLNYLNVIIPQLPKYSMISLKLVSSSGIFSILHNYSNRFNEIPSSPLHMRPYIMANSDSMLECVQYLLYIEVN